MTQEQFAAAIVALIADDTAIKRASNRDLAVIEGVLRTVLDSVTEELKRRDQP